jgi:hypothetical protein
MARSSQKFSVFEFDEEEEKVEKESARFVGKFRIQKRRRNGNNKDDDTSPRTKYKSLQCCKFIFLFSLCFFFSKFVFLFFLAYYHCFTLV